MDWSELFNRLDFKNKPPGHDDIQALMSEKSSSVKDCNRLLSFERYPQRSELDADSPGVNAFEETGAELAMNGDTAPDRPVHQAFKFIVQRRD
jgi:hypothetical protein